MFASLRRPKLIRFLGSDGRWRGWIVKGGENLQQDANIQRLLGFANYAIVSGRDSPTTCAPLLRTYKVIPISFQCGIIQMLDGTATLFSFCRNALSQEEAGRFSWVLFRIPVDKDDWKIETFVLYFSTECSALDMEVSRHSEDMLWSREKESTASVVVTRFTDLESFVFSLRLIRRGLVKSVATSAERFVSLRHRLVTSHATLSAVHFILGMRWFYLNFIGILSRYVIGWLGYTSLLSSAW